MPLRAAFTGDLSMAAAARLEVRTKFEVRPDASRRTYMHRVAHIPHHPPFVTSPLALCLPQDARAVADGAQVEQLQAEGREAADFIRQMVVQAPMNERGNYGGCTARRARGGGAAWRLLAALPSLCWLVPRQSLAAAATLLTSCRFIVQRWWLRRGKSTSWRSPWSKGWSCRGRRGNARRSPPPDVPPTLGRPFAVGREWVQAQ